MWITGAAALAGIGLLLWLGHLGWDRFRPNEQIAQQRYFCESLRQGVVRQPANTWSNLAFIVVALAIARWLGRTRLDGGQPSGPMADVTIARLYIALTAFLGVGSMCLHMSLTAWGGMVDVSSMIVFIAFVTSVSAAAWLRVSRRGLLALYAVTVLAAEGLYLVVPALGIGIFGALVGVFALAAWPRRTRWLLCAALCFLAGFGLWIPSQNGSAWCEPQSLLQGHAAWHVLCAAAAGFVFLHLRDQRTSSAGSIGG